MCILCSIYSWMHVSRTAASPYWVGISTHASDHWKTISGHWGSGMQNERGRILMRFVLAKGLQICNRQSTTDNMEASWTCCRTLDSTCVQLDYILANFRLQTVEVWNDFALPIGLDHCCAHCILRFQWCSRPRMRQQRGLKWWQPTLDSNGLPAKFHNIIRMNKVRGLHNSLEGWSGR